MGRIRRWRTGTARAVVGGRGLSGWIDTILAMRAADVDETYARLEGRPPLPLDDALDQVQAEGADRVRRRRAWWVARPHPVRALRVLRRSRLRHVAALAVVLLLRT